MSARSHEADIATSSARLADIDVTYSVAGSGERKVVLVHGLAEDRRTWLPQQRALDGVTSYAYDLRGHGGTSLGAAAGTLEQLGNDLIHFLEDVTGTATCVGFSLGGTVVLWAASRRPDLVPHAVVLGTSTVVGRSAVGFYDDRIARATAGDHDGVREALRADTEAGLADATDAVDDVLGRRMEAIGDLGGYLNGAKAMRTLRDNPLTSSLESITSDVDVVGGELDAFCPRKAADIMIAGLPSARYHEITGAGHLMNVDQPDAVTAVLRTTLSLED